MLIRFSVENFLSFKDRQTLDMSAVPSCKERMSENTFELNGETLLKTLVIYGANASGKSNLFLAMAFFCNYVRISSKDTQSEEKIPVLRFLLNKDTFSKPSCFEVEFIQGQECYRYGFEANTDDVIKEWLFKKGELLFLRVRENGDDVIQIEDGWKNAKGLEERTRDNALFLSVCAQFAMPEAENIMTWFQQKFHSISGDRPQGFRGYTIRKIHDGEYRDDIIAFLRNADVNILGVNITESEMPNENEAEFPLLKRTAFEVHTKHNVYDDNGNIVDTTEFPFSALESLGTQKAFALAGPIIDALKNGSILVVDELDSRLHPIFTRQIVSLFNSKTLNPLNAQLIFNTHDTNLLNYKLYSPEKKSEESLLRRDQIYFTEKDNMEATHLYSLVEFKKQADGKKVRNDASFEKDYLNGVYGAIPFIGNLRESPEDK